MVDLLLSHGANMQVIAAVLFETETTTLKLVLIGRIPAFDFCHRRRQYWNDVVVAVMESKIGSQWASIWKYYDFVGYHCFQNGFLLACQWGNVEMVSLLISVGAKIHKQPVRSYYHCWNFVIIGFSKGNYSPLILAVSNDNLDVVKVLLGSGVNIEEESEQVEYLVLFCCCFSTSMSRATLLSFQRLKEEIMKCYHCCCRLVWT